MKDAPMKLCRRCNKPDKDYDKNALVCTDCRRESDRNLKVKTNVTYEKTQANRYRGLGRVVMDLADQLWVIR